MKVKRLIKYLQSLPKNAEVFIPKEVETGIGYMTEFLELEEKDLYYDATYNQLVISEGR